MPIYPYLLIAPLAKGLKELFIVPLSSRYQRRKHHTAFAAVLLQDKVCYLVVGIFNHLFACKGRIGIGCSGIKKPEEVVNLCNCSNCRPWVVSCGLLFYGNDWAQAGYALHGGSLQYANILSGVCGECLHIAPLTLCIDCVECKRGLSAAAQAGYHHQLVARNLYIYTLKVVLAGTLYHNLLHRRSEGLIICSGIGKRNKHIISAPLRINKFAGTDPLVAHLKHLEIGAVLLCKCAPVGNAAGDLYALALYWFAEMLLGYVKAKFGRILKNLSVC